MQNQSTSAPDDRITQILAAFDAMLTRAEYRRPLIEEHGNVWLAYFMEAVTEAKHDSYLHPGKWTEQGARAVLVAYLTNCPAEYLDDALKEALRNLDECVLTDEDGNPIEVAA